MHLLGLDFETQGSDAATTYVTEVGAALYKYENKTLTKVDGFSAFCYEPHYPPQTPEIVELTGITDEMLKTQGKWRKEVFTEQLIPLMEKADFVLAHKVAFDKTVFDSTCRKWPEVKTPQKEWICTLTDWPWPKKLTCKKLSHLAYEHSILVDPATLHRAENDVDLMMRLVGKYDFEDVLKYIRTPWIYLQASDIKGPWVGRGGDGGVQTTIAKGLGFGWERIKGLDFPHKPKTWLTRVKETQVEKLMDDVAKSASPFRVSVIEGL